MHPNEHQNGHRLSTKWALGSDQSLVRSWPCVGHDLTADWSQWWCAGSGHT